MHLLLLHDSSRKDVQDVSCIRSTVIAWKNDKLSSMQAYCQKWPEVIFLDVSLKHLHFSCCDKSTMRSSGLENVICEHLVESMNLLQFVSLSCLCRLL